MFGNLIGTDLSGTTALANGDYGVASYGSGNVIGGAGDGQAGNVISGNRLGGVMLRSGTGNVVQRNLIGTDLSGTLAVGNLWIGVVVDSSNNTVGGVGEQGNVISGNSREGVSLYKPGNFVYGNLIGTDITGTVALGNRGWGMYLVSANNRIGGVAAGQEGNVISANVSGGVFLNGSDANTNVFEANWIGLDSTGLAGLGNTGVGMYVNRSFNNTIGGVSGAGNVVSANGREGIWITGDVATGNVVKGNRVGTDSTGAVALGNGSHGIYVTAPRNRIGGTAAGEGNLVSGNLASGVAISTPTAVGNVVQGNRIGTDASGSLALGNQGAGVAVAGTGTLVGGVGTAGNVISGNRRDGVQLWTSGNTVQGNTIGRDQSGAIALGNGQYGVMVYGANNTLGGVLAGEGNVIASNGFGGVLVSGSTSQQNAIQRNSIFENALLGIDLAPGGKTVNDAAALDADEGANRLQNFPELSAAVISGSDLTITYAVPSSMTYSDYPLAVEFFLADVAGQEGKTYLGTATYAAPDSATVTISVTGVSVGDKLVATATDAKGNTSEFSNSVVVTAALLASAMAEGEANSAPLNAAQLSSAVSQAVVAWQLAGLDAERLSRLSSLTFAVSDLPGRYLGLAAPDRILVDSDAAGYGWYIPEKSEISNPKSQMDLLTAVMHEMGHAIGLADGSDEDDLMAGVLQPGIRRFPSLEDLDQVLARGDWLDY